MSNKLTINIGQLIQWGFSLAFVQQRKGIELVIISFSAELVHVNIQLSRKLLLIIQPSKTNYFNDCFILENDFCLAYEEMISGT